VLIGVNYHPEHWPPERWREDARLMKEAGFNAVRMGEFAWSHLEPVRNKYRFRWLEAAVAIFAEQDIRTVLCTPTASPPPWLVERHPSIPPTDAGGQRLSFGTCRSYCANNPSYEKYSQRITAGLAEHFKNNKNVMAWQADSGFGRFGTARCYCRFCAQGFREWLQKKYGTLEELNRRWGTIVWSQQYSDWQQVPLPWRAVGDGELPHNPSLSLDYRRFCSDSWAAFQRMLVETVHTHCPGAPVTHNLAASVTEIDPFKLATDLNFVTASVSDCPKGYGADTSLFLEMVYALKDRKFWLAEADDTTKQSAAASSVPWFQQIVPFAYSALARGAEAVFFSRWRPAPFGAEQLKPGLLNHDGTPGRGLEAAARLARTLAKGGDAILRGPQDAKAALMLCHESGWALSEKPEPNMDYWDFVSTVYSSLSRQVGSLSVISARAALAPFKLVVAPALYVMPEDAARRLREYVERGGCLVMTCMSGIKDPDNNVWTGGLPGGMQDTLGLAVKSFAPIDYKGKVRVVATDRVFETERWNDVIELRDAKTLAVYADGPLKGLPAATVKAIGKGRAYYIGTCAEPGFYRHFLELACREAGIPARPFAGDGVEIVSRGELTFVTNQSTGPQTIALDAIYEDALRGTKHRGKIELPPDGVFVLKKIG
jgi:beta-galactosidase